MYWIPACAGMSAKPGLGPRLGRCLSIDSQPLTVSITILLFRLRTRDTQSDVFRHSGEFLNLLLRCKHALQFLRKPNL